MTFWAFEQVRCCSAPYTRSYVAPRCSSAYCFQLLVSLLVVLVPLLASFASDNFWVKEGVYHEQPSVQFAHELFLVLSGGSPDDALGWTSRSELEPLLPARVVVPTVRSTPYDMNHDGIPDTWKLLVEVPIGSTANASKGFRHVTLLTVYDIALREKALMSMQGMLAVDVATPFPATGVWVRGQARLRQNQPLRVGSTPRDLYAESPFAVRQASRWAAEHTPLRLSDLLDRYVTRNETVHLSSEVPPTWSYEPRASFQIELLVDVPPQPVYYVPPASEVLKLGWIQYLSLLIPAWIVLHGFKTFAFDNQIFDTFVMPHLPPKEQG